MIDQVRNSEDTELCKQILASISIVYRPITFQELASIIKLPNNLLSNNEILSEIISTYGSFLTLRNNTIIFIHQSTKEYLLSKAQNEIFPRGKEARHQAIFLQSFQVIFQTLHRDILQINFPRFTIDKVRQPNTNPLAHAQYTCVY